MQINREALRAIRQNYPLTRNELAERIGISSESLRKIENGTTEIPRPNTIRALASALDVEVGAFTIPSEVPMGDGGKGSGRKPGTPRKGKNAADDAAMKRLREAERRAHDKTAADARAAFAKKKSA